MSRDGNDSADGGSDSDTGGRRAKQRYYGKYRALVVNNVDPKQLGRIQVSCADVGEMVPLSWALPCSPFAGPGVGFVALPMPGSGVWIEFEQGDPNYPVWVGGFWGEGELPAFSHLVPPETPGFALQTLTYGIVVSDTAGILIQSIDGSILAINKVGIQITNGRGVTVTMTGPAFDVNLGALNVT